MARASKIKAKPRKRIRAARRSQPERELAKDRVVWLGQKLAGIWMTHDEALRLSAVWACVSVISKALASCRTDVFREDPAGNRESVPHSFGIWRLLNLRPNPETTSFAFKEAAFIQACINGNFYAEIERDMAGRPIALWPLAYERCTLMRDQATRRLVLEVQNSDGPPTLLDYDDVFHLHGPGVDGLAGFDTVTMAARSLAHLAAVERFGAAFYGNGTSMGGVLATEQNLTPERVTELREQVNARHQGPEKAFKFLLLHSGLKWQSTSVEPEKAQYVEGKIQLILDVCRWFGVPPHKIAELSRSTFSNIEHQGLEFVRDALTPWAERFAQEADWKLILANDFGTRFELEWLAEGDAKSKAETDNILVRAGLRTRNEVRRERGKNSLGPDGDKVTVEGQYVLLEQVGEEPPAPPPPAAPEETGGEEASPAERAARDIFRGTLGRAYERLARNRMQSAPGDADDLARDHARYVGSQIGVALSVLDRAGVAFDDDAVKALLAAQMEDDGDAIRCSERLDCAARAEAAASRLAALIRKG